MRLERLNGVPVRLGSRAGFCSAGPPASRRPVSGVPAPNEASADEWFTVGDLAGLDIHPSQRLQLRDWIDGTHPRID
jgi:hypothetical protein